MWRGAVCDVVMLGDDMLIDAASYKQVVVLCQVTRLYEVVVVVMEVVVVVSQIEVVGVVVVCRVIKLYEVVVAVVGAEEVEVVLSEKEVVLYHK